ncbi:dihydroorotate dehydrogenase electron transfer subunit [Leptotrichia sp. oral taxon 847]|uniref:dihydroorotate dehydrogenase electron transfer subunit n=1 Tax=Leptotrichia sp. oral taxon 847 TaxID=1785996 RepID=UPI0007682934|nr:dihydroorotate dehydrogenase electron transfer subunit [Leptotrichia sp. oral taxon 847]AMD95870.1 hypothetical protein AXF11_09980 [Leptotrichia sp. oral taxon 847]
MQNNCEKNDKKEFLENVEILENKDVGGDNFLMRVKSENVKNRKNIPIAGQFYMLKLKNEIMILRRPISLHSVDYETGEIEFLYKVLGKGTRELSNYEKGDVINIQGPLGNGFEIIKSSSKIVIVGGGIGLAPLKQLLKELLKSEKNKKIIFIAGGRDKKTLEILKNFDFSDKRIFLKICSDDGSAGEKANVIELLKKEMSIDEEIDVVYSCGPHKVLELISELANENGIISQVSMEERMACGVGACVGCSIPSKEGMKKVCKNGPVFYSKIFDIKSENAENGGESDGK